MVKPLSSEEYCLMRDLQHLAGTRNWLSSRTRREAEEYAAQVDSDRIRGLNERGELLLAELQARDKPKLTEARAAIKAGKILIQHGKVEVVPYGSGEILQIFLGRKNIGDVWPVLNEWCGAVGPSGIPTRRSRCGMWSKQTAIAWVVGSST